MGNSEVGHIHLGAGRINFESLAKLNNEVKTNNIATNSEFINAFKYAQKNNGALHLMGLFSDGGVHAHMDHMVAIYKATIAFGLKNIKFDLITDGRDTAPTVVKEYVGKLLNEIKNNNGIGVISSINGRYYAMDRDKRFERSAEAYKAIVTRDNIKSFTDPIEYIESQYALGKDDEMIDPAFNANDIDGQLKAGDAMIFTNFRPDRAIQMASIMTNPGYVA
jgi:2,3-bisphosphoglycerate-independent phosphoglycerate mutase